jgi:hypothetical protein
MMPKRFRFVHAAAGFSVLVTVTVGGCFRNSDGIRLDAAATDADRDPDGSTPVTPTTDATQDAATRDHVSMDRDGSPGPSEARDVSAVMDIPVQSPPTDGPATVPTCGNGMVETGETCDPVSQCMARQTACTSSGDTIRTGMGDPSKCTFRCVETARVCGAADGTCPPGCTPAQDVDCKKTGGVTCGNNAECVSNACVDGVCCTQNCAVCQNCLGAGGTCQNIARGTPDNSPSGACAGGSFCDGSSPPRCVAPACAMNERRCDGDTVQICKADRTAFEVDKRCAGMKPYCYQDDCTGCRSGQGSCGDGLCPSNCPNETVTGCPQDCGPLPDRTVRRGGTGLITPDVVGECGAFQAVTAWTAEGVWCTTDNAAFAHSASDCRITDYSGHPEYAGLSNCQDNEILAGIGRTLPGLYLCCRAPVGHRDCQRQTTCRPGQYAANHGYARDDTTFMICCTP